MKKLAFIFVLLLSGCMSTGTQVEFNDVNKFVKGQTTLEQVIGSLGQPQSVVTNSNNETIIVYTRIDTSVDAATYIPIVGAFAGGATSTVESYTFTFDKNNILTDWTATNTTSDVNL